ncbi:MAG: NAD(P)/FAD-dependent oxidoreductase [Acidobacteriota bacterium]|nr:NAD(P)/FAD-dependent oxidoreductase [Acidobacteriota bacterium]
MDSCDVLIVGGGPAGSSCAWGLRESGLDTLVIDRCTFPRNKLCGGWITPLVFEALEIDPESYAPGRVLQRITGFRLSSIEERQVDIRYGRTISYGILRCEFDEYLLRRCGARIQEGVRFNSIQRSRDGWIVNGEIKTRLVVGAGGHFCPVSHFLGNKVSSPSVVAREIEFEMGDAEAASSSVAGELPELYFCRDMRGYGWCFRKQDVLTVGIGRIDNHGLSQHCDEFLRFLKQSRNVEVPGKGILGHAYRLFGHSQRAILDNSILLVGDAAGLAYPESGEGIRPAIESGLIAAHSIVSAEGDYSSARLELYRELLNTRLGHKRNALGTLAQFIPQSVREICGRFLLRNRWFCRNVVLDRWFLRADERPLVFASEMVSPPAATTA